MAQPAAAQGDESPCVHICLMDYRQGLCIGCCRTLDEITHWINFSPEQKQAVRAQFDTRRAILDANT